MVKKSSYKKAIFDRLNENWERELWLIRSVGTGDCISTGYLRQKLAYEHMRASGAYSRCEYDFPVDLPDGHRSTQKIDIVCWKPNSDIHAFDSKSETTNGTIDPHITVVGHLTARSQLMKLYTNVKVTYSLLRMGGHDEPIWSGAGISTLDTNRFLTELRGFVVDLHEEERVQRAERVIKRLTMCCKHIEQPLSWGKSVLKKHNVPGC